MGPRRGYPIPAIWLRWPEHVEPSKEPVPDVLWSELPISFSTVCSSGTHSEKRCVRTPDFARIRFYTYLYLSLVALLYI